MDARQTVGPDSATPCSASCNIRTQWEYLCSVKNFVAASIARGKVGYHNPIYTHTHTRVISLLLVLI